MIGAALVARAAGSGHRAIGGEVGVPAARVRGWLRVMDPRLEAGPDVAAGAGPPRWGGPVDTQGPRLAVAGPAGGVGGGARMAVTAPVGPVGVLGPVTMRGSSPRRVRQVGSWPQVGHRGYEVVSTSNTSRL